MLDRFCGCRIAAMTGLDTHAQVVIIFLPSVVFDLKEDPVEQSGFVAVHQLWKDTVVLVVNWKTKFQLPYASDWNLLLQGYGVELTSPNIPAWY